MKMAILTSENQWFSHYAPILSKRLGGASVYYQSVEVEDNHEILFILGCHEIVSKKILARNRYNLVIHESELPQGKGWAPLFWQIIEGKNEITFSMIEATAELDSGPIYMKKKLYLTGLELNSEIRKKQADLSIDMCLEFVDNFDSMKEPLPQRGDESFYKRRTPADSRLDISKTIEEQFNLLRTVDNNEYPAFFDIDDNRYIIKIEESNN